MNDDGVSKRPRILLLIMMVSFLGVGVKLLQLLWGLMVVLNDSTTTFLECKGA